MRRLRMHYPNSLDLTGQGFNLELTFTANLRRRRAEEIPVRVSVTLTRPNIRCLLEQIAAMHVRDRARIIEETKRIEMERQILVGSSGG